MSKLTYLNNHAVRAASLALAALGAASLANATATITDLGVLSGSTKSYAYGINSSGHIAGFCLDSSSNPHAFYYDTSIHALSSGSNSHATCINDSDRVGGNLYGTYDIKPAVWPVPSTSLTTVATYTTGSDYHATTVFGISSNDVAAGDWIKVFPNDVENKRRASLFTLTSSGSPATYSLSQTLPTKYAHWTTPSELEDPEVATGVNASGVRIGYYYSITTGYLVGYVSSLSGTWLQGDVGDAIPWAITNDSHIVGQRSNYDSDEHATLWTPNGSGGFTRKDLGTLDGLSTTVSVAYGLNSSDDVVGACNVSGGGTHAFVMYSASSGGATMTDLNSLATYSPGGGAPNAILTEARGINSSGWICGTMRVPVYNAMIDDYVYVDHGFLFKP